MVLHWYWWVPVVCYVCFAVAAIMAFRRSRRWTMLVFFATTFLLLSEHLSFHWERFSKGNPGYQSPYGILESIQDIFRTRGVAEAYALLVISGCLASAVAGLVEIARLKKLPSKKASGSRARTTAPSAKKVRPGLAISGLALVLAIIVVASGVSDRFLSSVLLNLNVYVILAGAIGVIVLLIKRRRWLALAIGELALVVMFFL